MSETNVAKILVVDDEAELKNALVEALSAQSFDVRGFTNGAHALTALSEEVFDVLISDLMMPELDGITLTKKALEIDPHLVPIIMTGQGTIQTAVDAMKIGAFDYVLKPFRLATMLPTLTRAINARRLRLENMQLRETIAIYELCQTIAMTLDEQALISKLADAALQQTEADEVSILLPTSSGEELYVAAVRGQNRQRLLGERVPLEESISGWVVRQREPLLLTGEVNDARFHSLWPHPEIKSALSIPMQAGNKLIGTININALNRARPFTLGQMKALTILASAAAAALESASLYRQVQQAEEKYRSIFENAIEGIFQATPEGRFITVNPSLARIMGYDGPQDMITAVTTPEQFYVNAESRIEAARIEKEEGVLRGFEFQAYRKDGTKIWLSGNRHSVRNEANEELYREGSVTDITERKRMEAQRELLSALVQASPDFIGYADPKTSEILYINKHGRKMCGIGEDEELGELKISDVHPAWMNQRMEEVVLPAAVRDGLWEGDGAFLNRDGSEIPVSMLLLARKTANGEVDLFYTVSRDITERKKAEAELHFQKSLLEAQSEASIDGILVVSQTGQILSYNETFVDLWGISEELLTGSDEQALSSVLPLLAKPEEMLARVDYLYNHPEEEWRDEIELIDGRTFDRYSAPIKNTQEEYYGRVWFFRDITERKRGEGALRDSEERYRDLVENAHDIIYSHDLAGNYTSMNKAGELITGYTHEEALRLNLARTVAPEYLANSIEMLRRKLAGERVTAYEMELIRKDGRRVAVEVNTKLVFQNGVPVGVQGIARDVTDRKLLEEQFRQSQKMEAIGQLAGGVAHDFNNLLTAINGYTSLALQRLDEHNSVRPYLEEVKKAGDRAANLTRQLLAFGRKQILQPIPLDLNGTVSDMNKMLRRLIGEDINLSAKLATDLKPIKADPGQIEQVLMNLVVNARDAMPQGGRLTIETANVELDREYARGHVGIQPGNYVMLAVSDTGTGMSEETRARIFEPFFTTKEKGKGTGLGLSTVYGIVQQSGGSIWVYSEPNKGTSFKVYLPRLEAPVKADEQKPAPEIGPRGSETVLLVEDEDVVRGLATHILEDAGYKVLAARGGAEAIQLCTGPVKQIDLLLTDVVMPETSGKEVAERVTALRPHLKVLFMSGYTDEAIVHHGVLDSNVEFIQKPFTPMGLSKKVREVLDSNGHSDRD